jgi:hypothetical protein
VAPVPRKLFSWQRDPLQSKSCKTVVKIKNSPEKLSEKHSTFKAHKS